MSLTAKLKKAKQRRRYAAEQRSFRTVLLRANASLRDELIDMHNGR